MRTTLSGLPKYQEILYRLFFLFRLTELARFCNRAKTMILCYHGITQRIGPDPEDRSAIAVDRSLFLSQLKCIKRHYNVISLRDYLVARQSGKPLPRHSVILTFDDGLRNFLTVAAPILKELDLPATMFLVTDQVDMRDRSVQGSDWTPLDDQISLSWAEAKTLQSAQRIEFGSHTCSHPELAELSASVEREFWDSLRALREKLQDSFPPSLAYPYGDYTESIAAKARLAGYCCALTTEPGSNSKKTGLFQLRRAVVRRYDTPEIFAARVSGLIGWLRILRDLLRSLGLPLVRAWNAASSQYPSS
jgi:peptidoglycan/xylan/chitin deacetylase (PgdA/CDA1 family)